MLWVQEEGPIKWENRVLEDLGENEGGGVRGFECARMKCINGSR